MENPLKSTYSNILSIFDLMSDTKKEGKGQLVQNLASKEFGENYLNNIVTAGNANKESLFKNKYVLS